MTINLPVSSPVSIEHLFKATLSHVASAVSVVTTHDACGPNGTTVSAFTSLSLDPPMVMVSLARESTLLTKLAPGSPIGINVLAAHQQHVARQFAVSGRDKFADVDWWISDGAVVVPEHHAWVAGTVRQLVEGGDHVVVFVDVVNAWVGQHEPLGQREPLVYWQHTFGTHRHLGR